MDGAEGASLCCVEASTRGSYPWTVCFFFVFLSLEFPGALIDWGFDIGAGYGAAT